MFDFSKLSDEQLRKVLEENIDNFPINNHFSKQQRKTVVAERTRDELVGLLSENIDLISLESLSRFKS